MNRARKRRSYTAEEKCRVVLAMWTGRKQGTELCKELGVSWKMLEEWQARAMEGLVEALAPRDGEIRKGPMLGPRLKRLLDRKVLLEEGPRSTLGARIRGERGKEPAASTA